MSDIGTAYVNIVPKSDGIKNTLTRQFSQDGKLAGLAGGKSMMAGLTSTVAAAAAGLAVAAGAAFVGGISKAVSEGAKLEQSMGGIETLFKNNADEVIKNAEQAYKTAGLSANEYMENVTSFSASLIQSLGGDTKKAVDIADMAMVDMADNANKMGTDMSSIQNAYQGFAKQNYTMLDNLKLGYGGTKEEMERLLEDAGKLSGQTYDISSLDDVYQAIHVVQQELGITGTTAEEASQTLSGSFKSMKASFDNLFGALATGNGVEDAMQNLIDTSITFLQGNLIPAIVRVMKNLPKAIKAALSSDTVKSIPDIIEDLANKFDELAPVLAEKGADLIVKFGAGLIDALPRIISIMGTIVNGLLKVIVGLPALLLAKGLGAAGKFALGLLKGFNNAIGKVKGAIDKLLAPIKGFIDKVKGFFPINIGKILSGIKLPHFSVSGGSAPWGIGGKGSMPKFSVSWYAKGGILTEPTLFGAGEAGDEAILPLDTFWKKLEQVTSGTPITNNWYVSGADDPNQWAVIAARRLELELNAR